MKCFSAGSNFGMTTMRGECDFRCGDARTDVVRNDYNTGGKRRTEPDEFRAFHDEHCTKQCVGPCESCARLLMNGHIGCCSESCDSVDDRQLLDPYPEGGTVGTL